MLQFVKANLAEKNQIGWKILRKVVDKFISFPFVVTNDGKSMVSRLKMSLPGHRKGDSNVVGSGVPW